MFILYIILFILLLIFHIYFLIKSVKTRDNKNWLILFSLNVSSITSVILIVCYSLFNKYLDWNILSYLGLCLVELCYILIFIISLILKIIEVKRNKKQNITKEKLHTNLIKKSIMLPLVFVLFFTFLTCGIDYSKYVLQQRGEINTYNNVKSKEISKMANFLNNKYNLNIQEKDCIYYREQDYTRHSDIFGNGTTYNIPYIAVFETNNEKITVVDRKGFISDNKQLKDLNQFITDYYQEKTGINFEYVEFSKSYVGSWSGNDNIINTVLQTKFNKLITDKNIEELINYILQESDLSITFYIKDTNESNRDVIKESVTKNLNYLKEYPNVEVVNVYGYNEDLDIKHIEIDFPEEQIDYGNSSDDYNDGYKFGCYYVDSNSNNFAFLLAMDLDRGYTTIGEEINGWKYRILN